MAPTYQLPIVDPSNARSESYRKDLEAILASGQCPFCVDGFTWHNQEVLYDDGKNWWITQVRKDQQYQGSRCHFMIVPRKHLLSFCDITPDMLAGFQKALDWAQERFGFKKLTVYVREGDTSITGATVSHIHFVCTEAEEGQTVSLYLGRYVAGFTPSTGRFDTSWGAFIFQSQTGDRSWNAHEADPPAPGSAHVTFDPFERMEDWSNVAQVVQFQELVRRFISRQGKLAGIAYWIYNPAYTPSGKAHAGCVIPLKTLLIEVS